MKGRIRREKLMHGVFFLTACASILAVALICIFLFANGVPTTAKIGLLPFFTGKNWAPSNYPPAFGIFPMIVGSLYVTLGAILVGVPVGVLTAVFLAEYCPEWLYRVLKPGVQLLAGIPSVVYGFFGLMVLVPLIRDYLGGSGFSIAAASLLLGMMILPTVIGVSEAAIRSVPSEYYAGALALGANHERAVFSIVLPAARSGIFASVILGIGRAIGETMAVVMVAGNQPRLPARITQGVRTMTANIVLEMGYAAGLHREALIATGMVLFVFILAINLLFALLRRRASHGE